MNDMTDDTTIKVLLVDDHAIVRHGLRDLLTDAGGIDIVAEAANGLDAIRTARDSECTVMLLDISLPDRNGIEVLKQVSLVAHNQCG